MCIGGGSSGSSSAQQAALQQQQIAQSAQTSAAQLAEQQREFAIQQQQSQDTLANTKALQDKNQAEVDQQAELTKEWQLGRADNTNRATSAIDQAFSQFTPAYYAQFTKDYTDHYDPQVEQQFGVASNDQVYGLARTGNLNSQTAADQIGTLATEHGKALDDVNNAAIGATTAQYGSILNAKQNLMSQATSDSVLGSPVTPGSADAVQANFNNVSSNLARISNSAGDTVTTLSAVPQYSSLGSLFGSAAGTAGAAAQGVNNYNYGQAFQAGQASAGNPSSGSSGTVR